MLFLFLGMYKPSGSASFADQYMVTELMSGSARELLMDNIDKITLNHILHMARDAAAGMQYLASRHVIHRDLACRNLLYKEQAVTEATVGSRYTVKIADFGLSRIVSDSNNYYVSSDSKFPVKWTAPEALKFGKFSSASDVWSFGIVIQELLEYGAEPYVGMSTFQVTEQVMAGYRLPRTKNCPEKLYELLLSNSSSGGSNGGCWAELAADRPNFEQIVERLTKLIDELFPVAVVISPDSPSIDLQSLQQSYEAPHIQ